MRNSKLQKDRGFTLIETMFAVIIMAFSITIFMNVVANTLFSARYAKNEITANYLAQEAIDYIRNDRDSIVFFSNDAFSEEAWNNFLNRYSICEGENGCEISIIDEITAAAAPVFESCSSNHCSNLYYDPNPDTEGSFYTYDQSEKEGKAKTNFSRRIKVTKISESEVRVNVTVYWKNGSSEKSRSLDTSLTKWQ